MAWTSWHRGWLAVATTFTLLEAAAAAQLGTCTLRAPITTLADLNDYTNPTCLILTGDLIVENIITQSSHSLLKIPFKQVDGLIRISNITFESDDLDSGLQIDTTKLETVNRGVTFDNLRLDAMPDLSKLSNTQSLNFTNVTFNSTAEIPVIYNYYAIRNMEFRNCPGLQRIDVQRPPTTGAPLMANITVVGNQALTHIDMASYAEIQTTVVIQANSPQLSVNLSDVAKASFSIDSIEWLSANNLTQLGFDEGDFTQQTIQDTTLASLELPKLQWVKNAALNITKNLHLSSINFPTLAQVATLNISGNSNLKTVELPDLATVGTLLVSGPVENISYPSDVDILGQVIIEPEDASVCSQIDNLSPHYSCEKFEPSTTAQGQGQGGSGGQGTAGSSVTSGSSEGGLSTGAKIGIGVGVGLAGLLAILALVICVLRRRMTKARASRTPSSKEYWTSEPDTNDRSPVRYSKVPETAEGMEDSTAVSHRPVSSELADDWAPPERDVPNAEGRIELEEQQGPRHEMDARSLRDIDLDADGDEDTRSLQDIERAHGHMT